MHIRNYSLLNADFYSYYPAPKFWFRWKKRFKYTYGSWKNIYGFEVRLWKIGFACDFLTGGYYGSSSRSFAWNHGPMHWILWWYTPYDEYLENGGI